MSDGTTCNNKRTICYAVEHLHLWKLFNLTSIAECICFSATVEHEMHSKSSFERDEAHAQACSQC